MLIRMWICSGSGSQIFVVGDELNPQSFLGLRFESAARPAGLVAIEGHGEYLAGWNTVQHTASVGSGATTVHERAIAADLEMDVGVCPRDSCGHHLDGQGV